MLLVVALCMGLACLTGCHGTILPQIWGSRDRCGALSWNGEKSGEDRDRRERESREGERYKYMRRIDDSERSRCHNQ
jgi:hypothetical protein